MKSQQKSCVVLTGAKDGLPAAVAPPRRHRLLPLLVEHARRGGADAEDVLRLVGGEGGAFYARHKEAGLGRDVTRSGGRADAAAAKGLTTWWRLRATVPRLR